MFSEVTLERTSYCTGILHVLGPAWSFVYPRWGPTEDTNGIIPSYEQTIYLVCPSFQAEPPLHARTENGQESSTLIPRVSELFWRFRLPKKFFIRWYLQWDLTWDIRNFQKDLRNRNVVSVNRIPKVGKINVKINDQKIVKISMQNF